MKPHEHRNRCRVWSIAVITTFLILTGATLFYRSLQLPQDFKILIKRPDVNGARWACLEDYDVGGLLNLAELINNTLEALVTLAKNRQLDIKGLQARVTKLEMAYIYILKRPGRSPPISTK